MKCGAYHQLFYEAEHESLICPIMCTDQSMVSKPPLLMCRAIIFTDCSSIMPVKSGQEHFGQHP